MENRYSSASDFYFVFFVSFVVKSSCSASLRLCV